MSGPVNPLVDAEGATLLALARAAIGDSLGAAGGLERVLAAARVTAGLRAPRAAFVTLQARPAPGRPAELRGCIGTMDASRPLYRNVIEIAPRAAAHDPRFPPLVLAELPRVRVEVSALTPLEPLADPDAIVLGRDGVQLSRGDRRALFLPQVAEGRDWSVETFLDQLAQKAGLPAGAWREATLEVFRVEAFAEPAPQR